LTLLGFALIGFGILWNTYEIVIANGFQEVFKRSKSAV
jgi:hypothetical protein